LQDFFKNFRNFFNFPMATVQKTTSNPIRILLALGALGVFWLCLWRLVHIFTPQEPGFVVKVALPEGSKLPAPPEILGKSGEKSPEPPIPPVEVEEIVIDPGHGGKDPGTRGNEIVEKDGTLLIANALYNELKDRGYKVLLTRKDDSTLELEERAQIANRAPRKAFISVHLNHGNGANARGIETYYCEARRPEAHTKAVSNIQVPAEKRLKDERSKQLATLVQREITESSGAADRTARTGNGLVVLNSTACPAILIECGFVSDKTEAERLKSAAYHKKLAKGIADGLEEFLKAQKVNPNFGLVFE
jgi:N-acetylmuramoyl-L-alanine amidase